MLLQFTETNTKNTFAINPEFIVGVFVSVEEATAGKTLITLRGGSIVVDDTYLEVVGQINSQLK